MLKPSFAAVIGGVLLASLPMAVQAAAPAKPAVAAKPVRDTVKLDADAAAALDRMGA